MTPAVRPVALAAALGLAACASAPTTAAPALASEPCRDERALLAWHRAGKALADAAAAVAAGDANALAQGDAAAVLDLAVVVAGCPEFV
ncbi:MAG: hypothetical protein FJ306_06080, partial [Planctomycetes bacterium]|nr:hypothetical protein [Planctomycetota bacterium]